MGRLGAAVANVCAACVLCAACSSASAPKSTGSGSATGTIHGGSLPVADAISLIQTIPGSGNPPSAEIDVGLSNFGGLCAASSYASSSAILVITVVMASTNGGSLVIDQPVMLPIDGATTSVEYLAQPGSQCMTYDTSTGTTNGTVTTNFAVFEEATSGTVTITRADATGVSGSYTAVFSSGDMLSGSFDAPACSNAGAASGC